MLKPRTKVPALTVKTLEGETWNLADQQPEHFTMIVFYRGYHCPKCKPYIRDLDRQVAEFEAFGVNVIAVSSDTLERAQVTREEWGLQNVKVGYGLPLDKSREWGLFISNSIKDGEPDMFSEPGLFLVSSDQTLFGSIIQTMPFARPHFDELRGALKWIIDNNYPARGEA